MHSRTRHDESLAPAATDARTRTSTVTFMTTAREALEWIRANSSRRDRENLARFGITVTKAIGISMAKLKVYAKRTGRDHTLALALWRTGWYDARMLACLVDDPALVTRAQMDAWCKVFDNWGICDTACFALFDRSELAWGRIAPWARQRGEYQRRAGFALLASLALHDKRAPNAKFVRLLPLIEAHATDDRNFVKKGVSWALRGIGKRNAALRARATITARRLATHDSASARWIGKDALREFARSKVRTPARSTVRATGRRARAN